MSDYAALIRIDLPVSTYPYRPGFSAGDTDITVDIDLPVSTYPYRPARIDLPVSMSLRSRSVK